MDQHSINTLINSFISPGHKNVQSISVGLFQECVITKRILTLVEYQQNYGLLVINRCDNQIDKNKQQLTVDFVLPIDDRFKCEFAGDNILAKIIHGKEKFIIELKYTEVNRHFFVETNKAQDVFLCKTSPSFDWLYRSYDPSVTPSNSEDHLSSQIAQKLYLKEGMNSITKSNTKTSIDLTISTEALNTLQLSNNSTTIPTTNTNMTIPPSSTPTTAHGGDNRSGNGKIGKSNFYVNEIESPDDLSNIPRDMVAMGVTPLAAREINIRLKMAMLEDQYTELKSFNIFIGSWNVNGQNCSVSLGENWLASDANPPDIYAIGFQELDLSKEAFVFNDSTREDEWLQACTLSLHPSATYVKVKLVRLIGMMLIVFVKRELEEHVSNVASETVGTGILGKMGNKGGVAIRFDFYNTSMCFVNSHLAAHVEEYERRNQDYNDICNRMIFSQFKPPKYIKDHDQVYWFGDLNYRLMDLNRDQVKNMLEAKAFEELLKHDQLRDQWRLKRIFHNFKEGPIKHAPTYKYDPGTDNWDSSEKNRPPAWCDRCLWRGDSIALLDYRSHSRLKLSDHKPISALFESSVKVKNSVKFRKVYEDVMKKMDKIENEFLPQVSVDQSELNFGRVTFREPVRRYLSIANTGQVPVRFEFIQKPNEVRFCKAWLQIQPYESMIKPGDKLDVELKVYVDIESSQRLNSGLEEIYDILVLHLEGGKDLFIEIKGSYKPSSFGSSIETLVRLKTPIDEMPAKDYHELQQAGELSSAPISWGIPKEIWLLVDHLFKYGLMQEDLFQQPGLNTHFQIIREGLDKGSLEGFAASIHSVAEALLIFLEALAEPLIPHSLYSRALENYHNFISCKQVINEMKDTHRRVFYYLISFMRELLRHSKYNNLDNKILASIFGDIVLRAPVNQSTNSSKGAHSNSIQEIEKKKAGFIHHFLVNDFDP
ncbi:inositol polyphosphate 5-phosphatase OCRL-like isoform X2 [Panonychus citri]|uniref:inositol polyphosphate 5-phosphatase OCRL-like isoform X2 n=1 Tax=Panonychus citri TaxID=50023 RepID=UPI002307722D|nr:inositol polyphosphate 5-phosphatase OCRL-like isoform X2 [Panonychus citri]